MTDRTEYAAEGNNGIAEAGKNLWDLHISWVAENYRRVIAICDTHWLYQIVIACLW